MGKKSAVHQFIDEERSKGVEDKHIRHRLLDAGWHMDIIHHAMHKNEEPGMARPVGTKPLWQTPKGYAVIGGVIFLILVLIAMFA